MDARESSEHIGPEACEVIIVMLQRDPGSWKRSVLEPGREEGRLAKASRGCDERERAFHRLLESLDEVGTAHELQGQSRHVELGSKRWITAHRGQDVPLHLFRWGRWPLLGDLSPCVPIGCMCERLGHRVQALQRQGLCLPKVERGVLAVLRTVSFPVPSATLIASA